MTDEFDWITFPLRAGALGVLAVLAGWVWARPWTAGMTEQDAHARAARARRWCLVAIAGALTYSSRPIGAPVSATRITGTIFVFLIVSMGIDGLRARRAR